MKKTTAAPEHDQGAALPAPPNIKLLSLSIAVACRGLIAVREAMQLREVFIMLQQRDEAMRRLGVVCP